MMKLSLSVDRLFTNLSALNNKNNNNKNVNSSAQILIRLGLTLNSSKPTQRYTQLAALCETKDPLYIKKKEKHFK